MCLRLFGPMATGLASATTNGACLAPDGKSTPPNRHSDEKWCVTSIVAIPGRSVLTLPGAAPRHLPLKCVVGPRGSQIVTVTEWSVLGPNLGP